MVLRALALCRLDEGRLASEVAAEVRLTANAVHEIGRRYEDGGLERALYERPHGFITRIVGSGQIAAPRLTNPVSRC
jgi:hypothetical protein